MCCTMHGIFMLCVICVIIIIVIGTNIGTHDKGENAPPM
jgi:hypothetical protein